MASFFVGFGLLGVGWCCWPLGGGITKGLTCETTFAAAPPPRLTILLIVLPHLFIYRFSTLLGRVGKLRKATDQMIDALNNIRSNKETNFEHREEEDCE